MALKVGDKAPEFKLKDSFDKEVSLSDFKGKRIILYFYPKDNTPGCTKEACNFKENWDLLQKNNIIVLGISKDNASSHQKFIEKFNLPFILLTDPEPFKKRFANCRFWNNIINNKIKFKWVDPWGSTYSRFSNTIKINGTKYNKS